MDDLALKFLLIGLLLVATICVMVGLAIFLWQRHRRRRIHIQKILPAHTQHFGSSKFNRSSEFPLGGELKGRDDDRNGFAQQPRKTVEASILPSPPPTFLRPDSRDKKLGESYRRVEDDVNPPAVDDEGEHQRSVVVIRTDDYGGGIMIVEGQTEADRLGGGTNRTSITIESDVDDTGPSSPNRSYASPQEGTLSAHSLWAGGEPSPGAGAPSKAAARSFKIDLGSMDSAGDFPTSIYGGKLGREDDREDNDQISREFEELHRAGRSTIRPKSTVAEMNENIRKNRFYDILPYDFNRVKLKGTPSDYINASYIFVGENSSTRAVYALHNVKVGDDKTTHAAYIAAQGPIGDEETLKGRRLSTVQDFWWMVWDESVDCIVMLTPCFEGIKPKCPRYWPENAGEVVEIGDGFSLLMYCVTEDEISFQREIWLERRGHPRRRITQWHFKDWSDFAGPSDPAELLAFVETVRASNRDKRASLLVHCSAGVGRTGVYIAIDTLLDRFASSKLIDVMATVRMLRESRTSMVQNVEQYATIYETIALAIRRTSGRRGFA